jgi:hypothetical protein
MPLHTTNLLFIDLQDNRGNKSSELAAERKLSMSKNPLNYHHPKSRQESTFLHAQTDPSHNYKGSICARQRDFSSQEVTAKLGICHWRSLTLWKNFASNFPARDDVVVTF